MKKLDSPENILPSSILICPQKHYLIESSDYIGKGIIQKDLPKNNLTIEMKDIFYCKKCNRMYEIEELKRG